ncbi:ABC transporter permease/M1 family aminopeptidase [Niveispirillum sp. KHB5.9]|uniref:ABC transporter permease/M1 family aminopeptidase n=1 Tax=Niveispirillum sp. KHB5.9 TaxID=3400269 RepID=UPI003A88A44B
MRAFLETFRFEARVQARSALFAALVVITAFIHFCAARKWGIDIGLGAAKDAAGLEYNSALSIIQNALILSLFSAFPSIALVAGAVTRDGERRTAPLFHTKPIHPATYACGRFAGGMALALLTVLAGLSGALAGLALPGVDTMHLLPFSAAPFLYALFAIAIPNMLITGALACAAALAARSIAAAYCVALALPLIPVMAMPHLGQGGGWLGLIDPFGAVSVMDVTRFWSRQELVTRLPGDDFWLNRLLWLALAGSVLAAAVWRFRFQLDGRHRRRAVIPRRMAPPAMQGLPIVRRFDAAGTWSQFLSQLRMDMRAIWWSAPFHAVALLVIAGCVDAFETRAAFAYNTPQLPLTSRLVGVLDVGLALQMILAIAYYAGALTHRARQARVADIIDASPVRSFNPVFAQLAALVLMVTALLALAIGTFMVLQLAQGFDDLEPGLYLRGLFIYGFNHYALIVPALLVHLLVPNRWLGMLLFLLTVVAGFSLRPLGLEDILYNPRLASPPYSDMNGFGHFSGRHVWLMIYWTAIMALLALVAVMAAPRGHQSTPFHDARARLTPPLRLAAILAVTGTAASGGWIFYNTHIRNAYVTSADLEARAAEYERRYQQYADLRSPAVAAMDVAVDFFPAERRVESRGTLHLQNRSAEPVSDLFFTLNPALRVELLELDGAQLVESDQILGVRRYRLAAPLAASATVAGRWHFSWRNDGFTNAASDNAIAGNGSNIEGGDILPMPGYRAGRALDDPDARRRQGLPPARPLPALDDPAVRNDLTDPFAPVRFRAVLGTSGDQTALTSGRLTGEWAAGGRRYFRYEGTFPLYLAFASARYQVMREVVDGVTLELFHDRGHGASARTIMDTMKHGLDYYSREYAPYFLDNFKIFEYPRYSTRVHAMAGAVSYNEAAGFTLAFQPGQTDIVTAHELAHMWWGGQVRSPRLEGQQVINEGLATFASFMLIEHMQGREAALPYVAVTRDQYLDAYSRVVPLARPVIRAQSTLDAYGKASLALYTLHDVIGAAAVNGALRGFLAKYGNRPPPFPTTRELVAELRAAAGPDYQPLITDLFEKTTFYDIAVTAAESHRVAEGYEVTINVAGRKIHADDEGLETDAPLHAPFDITVYDKDARPLLTGKHWLTTGEQVIRLQVKARPGRIAVDPDGMMLDRNPSDNARDL